MKVYVLMGYVQYEDTFLLGIYSTHEKAFEAKTKTEKEDPDIDEIYIDEWEVE